MRRADKGRSHGALIRCCLVACGLLAASVAPGCRGETDVLPDSGDGLDAQDGQDDAIPFDGDGDRLVEVEIADEMPSDEATDSDYTEPDVAEGDGDDGAEDGDVPATMTSTEFCHRWSVAVDAYHLHCCTAEEQTLFYPTPGPEAVARVEAACQNNIDIALESGPARLDPEAAASCIAMLEEVAEACPNYGAYPVTFVVGAPWEPDCAGVVVGLRAEGEACETHLDCARELYCDWSAASPRCTPRQDAGGACEADYPHQCRVGMVCVDGACATRGDEGAACYVDHHCRVGLRCASESGTCVPLSPAGAVCGASMPPTCLGRCIGPPGDDGVCIDFCDGDDGDVPPGPECCTDRIDDDADGFTDCDDYDCAGNAACTPCWPGIELCWDGCDNDGDCRTDSEAPEVCPGHDGCNWHGCPPADEVCTDGCDNDRDAAIDCADPDCAADAGCAHCPGTAEDTYGTCGNGLDDDCDGLTDGYCELDCMVWFAFDPLEDCSDGVDNDVDSLADCADDDCRCVRACTGVAPEVCDDGIDNDADTLIDAADWDCPMAC